jgi:hypothetical protein
MVSAKQAIKAMCTALVLISSSTLSTVAAAQEPQFPSSAGNDIGDHLRLTTDVWGFEAVSLDPAVVKGKLCAGKFSTYSRISSDATATYVKFYHVNKPLSRSSCASWTEETDPKGVQTFTGLVAEGAVYRISNAEYANVSAKSTGLAYGALVVPFKFRLGSDKKLVSSATIAPYLGVRWAGFQGWGYEFMPVVSAGLGLVPIADPATKATETRAAFSTALGITLNSKKSDDFSAGILFGKDFLSSSDRMVDPSVNKMWVSIWIGIAK